jgi:ATP/maltotriose-dependent transcriptional regulator MalT
MAPTLAKLTRPKLHRVAPRERLFDTLDRCRERLLTWVSGPPGGGKTALLASYLQARKLAGLWYQIDAGDADLAAFFHYLSEAAPPAACKASLPQLATSGQTNPRGFCTCVLPPTVRTPENAVPSKPASSRCAACSRKVSTPWERTST